MTARISLIAATVISLAILLAVATSAQELTTQGPSHILTTTASVQSLSKAEADLSPPVRIEGTVSFSHPAWRILFLQDDTGGIFCDPLISDKIPEPGTRLVVHGLAANGSFLPYVNLHRMEVLGKSDVWPPARPARAAELWRGQHDAGLVRVRGYISSVTSVTNPLPLTAIQLISEGLPVEVRILGNDVLDAKPQPSAWVEVEGVFGPTADAQRRVNRVMIQLARPEQFKVLKSAAQMLAALPTTPLHHFSTNTGPQENTLVRVQGVVSLAETNGIYLVNSENGVHVHAPAGLRLARREAVELTALVIPSARETQLQLVQLLSRTPGTLPIPTPMPARELSEWSRYGQQVRVEGEFLHSSPEPDGWLLVMRDQGKSFEVQLRFNPNGLLSHLQSGMRLQVSGTLRLITSSTSEGPVARILVADEQDLIVLTPPPWPLHLTLLVVSLLSAALAIGLVALGLAHRGLRASNRRAADAEIALRKLNSELEKRIIERTAEHQSSEARFRTLVESTDVILWEHDPTAKHCKYVSPQAARLGYPLGDWTQPDFWRTHLHPEDREHAQAVSATEIAAGRSHRIQYRMLDARGESVWIDDLVTCTTRPDGSRIVRGVMTDITDRKRIEEDLVIREERLRLALESTDCGVFDNDLVNGRLHLSSTLKRLLGLEAEIPLEANQIAHLIHPQDIQLVAAAAGRARDPKGDGVFLKECRVILPNGSIRWLAARSQTFFSNEGGLRRATRVTGVVRDVTENRTAENALRESEERFARAFHASPAIIVITRRSDHRIIDVNNRYTEVMGYTREETIGKTSLEMGFYVDLSKRRLIIETAEAGRAIRDLECSYRDKFGRYLTMLTSVENIMVKGEDSLLAFCHDITRRKRTEDALRALVSRRSLNPGDTFFTRLARSLAEIFQTKIALVAEKPNKDSGEVATLGVCLGGKTEANFRKQINDTPCAEVFKEGIKLVASRLPERFPKDELLSKLGAESYFGIAVRDSQEQPIGLLAIVHDAPLQVSPENEPILRLFAEVAGVEMERARALEAIRSAEARFRSAIEHSFECIVMANHEMTCTYVSPGVQRILGYSPQDIVGRRLVTLLWPEDQPAAEDHYHQLLLEPEAHAEIELRARHQDGACRWIQMSDTNRLQDPNLKAIVSNLRDVTERKEADQARRNLEVQLRQSQKMEAIGTLAGGIAHDFNNMLGIIIGQSELARHHLLDLNAEASDCLGHVLQASHRAKELVRQILTFSRREEFQRTLLHPESILGETLNLLRSTLPASIEVSLNIHSPVPTIYGNSTLIQQIVVNLATNAAQAIGDRKGRVSIVLRERQVRTAGLLQNPELSPGNYVELSVEDNGPGIEPALLDRVFEPFFTTKGPGEGTGLGLSVVHGIVQAHDGTIHVASHLGSGTRFTIHLPATHAVPETFSSPSSPSSNPFVPGSERILLIDDEPSLLKLGEWVLRRSGYQVHAFLNPNEALDLFRASPRSFDLVITDYSMPGTSGVDLALSMRELRADVPMLICTGYGAGLTTEKARRMGFRAVLQKPLEIAEFSRAVRLALDDPAGTAVEMSSERAALNLEPV
ncbi:MAG: PAS domain S-box protein [Verrucomicrobiales bacterium]|nr:PAS domain S-box protein [Verrucomicrobiales bacterium]